MPRYSLILALLVAACDVPSLDGCREGVAVGADTCGPLPELLECARALPRVSTTHDGWCTLGGRLIRWRARINRGYGCAAAAVEAQVMRPTVAGGEAVCSQDLILRW